MKGDEKAEEQDQRGGDEQLRAETAGAVAVDLRTRGAANRAPSLDDRPSTVCADQVLAAHLSVPLPLAAPGRSWRDLQA